MDVGAQRHVATSDAPCCAVTAGMSTWCALLGEQALIHPAGHTDHSLRADLRLHWGAACSRQRCGAAGRWHVSGPLIKMSFTAPLSDPD